MQVGVCEKERKSMHHVVVTDEASWCLSELLYTMLLCACVCYMLLCVWVNICTQCHYMWTCVHSANLCESEHMYIVPTHVNVYTVLPRVDIHCATECEWTHVHNANLFVSEHITEGYYVCEYVSATLCEHVYTGLLCESEHMDTMPLCWWEREQTYTVLLYV